jgi:hypothetical protein
MPVFSRRHEQRIANAVIADPEQRTSMSDEGAARSVQAANVDMPERELDAIWSAMHLERLARTYWWYLSRISLGLIRVHYGADERAVVLIRRPFVLLRFQPPDYEVSADKGEVTWLIRDGILVGRKDAGHLRIVVQRSSSKHPGYARIHVEVEVANFYPRLARPFRWFYVNTQSRIHVVVTHGFLHHLARLDLQESPVGRFAVDAAGPRDERPEEQLVQEDITIGDTPWGVVAALAAAFAVVAGALTWALRTSRG